MTKTQPTTAPTPPESAPSAAPAQGEPTETVMRNALCRVYEIINGSDDFDADEVNAIIKAATGNFPISREWSMGAAYKEEIVTLRQQLAQMEEERDQARQDLEERCAENDRERAAHLQAYQEACKERDEARAELASQFLVKAGMGSQLEQAESDLAELRKDRDDAFAYIHSLWLNGQLPAPMTDSLRARIQNWGEPKET